MNAHRIRVKSWVTSTMLAMLSMFSAASAHAADGCKFLLCIAGPWSSIAACQSTVHEVFRDLARGRPFPTCGMTGAGNTASNTWVDEGSCPGMYRQHDSASGGYSGCTYPARISVYINGGMWSQVYWDMSANTSTWYSPAARSGLTPQAGSAPLDDRFQNDLMGWNSVQVAPCRSGSGTVVFDAFGAFQQCSYPWSGGGF